MKVITVLSRVFRPSHDEPKTDPRCDAMEFLATEEAQDIPLHKFEDRFEITEIDFDAEIIGFPDSLLYEPESPEEIQRNRKFTDEFLKAGERK